VAIVSRQLLAVLVFVSFAFLMLYLVLNIMLSIVYTSYLTANASKSYRKDEMRHVSELLAFKLCDTKEAHKISKQDLKVMLRVYRAIEHRKFTDEEFEFLWTRLAPDDPAAIEEDEFLSLVKIIDHR
jgi:hypothetical protein